MTVRIRWLRAEEGGRSQPPGGPEYRATAVFSDLRAQHDASEQHVSIVLNFDAGTVSAKEPRAARLRTIVPDLLGDYFGEEGVAFVVMEGHRPVATGEVASVDPK